MDSKRILALLLAAMFLTSAVSCAGSEEPAETTADTISAVETEAETELTAELPDKTYNGEEEKRKSDNPPGVIPINKGNSAGG